MAAEAFQYWLATPVTGVGAVIETVGALVSTVAVAETRELALVLPTLSVIRMR